MGSAIFLSGTKLGWKGEELEKSWGAYDQSMSYEPLKEQVDRDAGSWLRNGRQQKVMNRPDIKT